jgi:hypothetical protein
MAADRTTPARPAPARRRLASFASIAAALVAVAWLPASNAAADIVVDPDAPAGIQYGAPLDRERAKGAGGGDAGAPGSSETAPLFGEGVVAVPGAGGGGSGGDGGTGGSAGGDPVAAVASASGTPQELKLAALVLSVLAAGGALGLALSRRRSAPV